jgi:hypothetical protein
MDICFRYNHRFTYSTSVNNAKLWQLAPAESHFLFKRLVTVPHGKRPLEQSFHQWQRTLVIPLNGKTRKYFQLHLISKLKTIMSFLSVDKGAVAIIHVSNFHGRTDAHTHTHSLTHTHTYIYTHTQEACCMLYNFMLSFMEF